ncbi:hypothetical protein NDU88_001253 [Pleurodeles waltl]|uniref:Uncharacterized protein n=1 Tax=Pleurodeles waltl TaxID=8319 RepID=A0AAV7P6L2_PLEWA|nr:hypothetical protein NDU88_001253 [Pleurodeles waltl]
MIGPWGSGRPKVAMSNQQRVPVVEGFWWKTVKSASLPSLRQLSGKIDLLREEACPAGNSPPFFGYSILEGGAEERVGEVCSEVSLLHQDLRNVAERVTIAETLISHLEETAKNLSKEMTATCVLNKDVMWWLKDAENRARRNNLRFVGFSEEREGKNATRFQEMWLKSVLPTEKFLSCFLIKRAHRALERLTEEEREEEFISLYTDNILLYVAKPLDSLPCLFQIFADYGS